MKFGKTIKELSLEVWKYHYINYKRLKTVLSQLVKEDRKQKKHEENNASSDSKQETTFVIELDKQLMISSTFFQQKILESNRWFQSLTKNLKRFSNDGSLQVLLKFSS